MTTTQQNISPKHPSLTTPKNTKATSPQITLQSIVKPSATFAPKFSQMDYQTFRPMTRPPKPRRIFTRNSFAEHNYNYTHPPRPHYPPRKPNNNLVCSNIWDRPTTTNNSENFQPNQHPPQDHSENYPFFQQNKNDNKNLTIRIMYHPMMIVYQVFLNHTYKSIVRKNHDALNIKEFFLKTHQIFKTNNHRFPSSYNTQCFQPMQTQNPMTMHSYQPNQMQNEIPLPYYLQQHETTKNQLTNFSQIPNAAELLQMTMNPYLMGGSSITSNKPLMVFAGTDPEYSVEDYLNTVTANLILNIGPEPIKTPLHQNWIQRRTALIQTTLDGAAKKWFSVLPMKSNQIGKDSHKNSQRCLILKETNNIKEFYVMKFEDYQMKQ